MKLAATVLASAITSLAVLWFAFDLAPTAVPRGIRSSSQAAFAATPHPVAFGPSATGHAVIVAAGAEIGGEISRTIAGLSGAADGKNGCGTIVLPEGTYTLANPIRITNPCVSIYGQGRRATLLKYQGAGAALEFTDNHFGLPPRSPQMGGTLAHFAIQGNASPGAAGIHVGNLVGLTLEDLEIYGFSGGSCVWFDNTIAFTERYFVSNVDVDNCAAGLRFTKSGGNASFEHGHIQVFVSVRAGQTGVLLEDGAFVARGYLEINGNIQHGGTLVRLAGNSHLVEEFVVITVENTDVKGAEGIVVDSTSTAALTGLFWPSDGWLRNSAPPSHLQLAVGNGHGAMSATNFVAQAPPRPPRKGLLP
ncbi:MAG: hypothetical protein WA005_13775 [Candidatus Binataceae bacterium]